SNPPIWQLATLLGSLAVFDQTSMAALRAKSVLLTGYLETRLRHLAAHPPPRAPRPPFTILTPSDPAQRGAQLSLLFHAGTMPRVAHGLMLHGVVCDERKPDVIRIAPTPLYGSFAEVWRFVDVLRAVLAEATTEPSA
ncbi:PLP-dependent transferase, partial [Caulochytrium protostelioides]